MTKGVEGNGRVPRSVLERVAGNAVAVPVTAGFVALGAGVIVGRSLLGLTHRAWTWVPPVGRGRLGPHQARPRRFGDTRVAWRAVR